MAEDESFFIGCLKVVRKVIFFSCSCVKARTIVIEYVKCTKMFIFSPLLLIVETDWVCMCARVKQRKKNTEIYWKRPAAPLAKPRFKYSNRLLRWELFIFLQTKPKFLFTFVLKLKFYRISIVSNEDDLIEKW